MQALVDYVDRTGKYIALTSSAGFGGNKKRLMQFYKRFGFVENKGKNRAFTVSEDMYRPVAGKTLYQSAVDGVRRLTEMPPINLDDVSPVVGKKAIEDAFRGFGSVKIRMDHRVVHFPASMAGKIVRHRGFEIAGIAGAFDRLLAARSARVLRKRTAA